MIGIIGAMQIEVDSIKEQLKDSKEKKIGSIVFTKGILHDKSVVIATCGIGKVFAAICAQTMILNYDLEYLINVGVGGTLTSSLSIGSIAISSALVQHDMDTSPLGDPVGLISGINIIKIPADTKIIKAVEEAIGKSGLNFKTGIIASGDQFINNPAKKEYIKSTFNAIACEMEGAAIAQVCYVNHIPFCIIRAISDCADGKSHMDYEDFIKMAVSNSVKVINNLI